MLSLARIAISFGLRLGAIGFVLRVEGRSLAFFAGQKSSPARRTLSGVGTAAWQNITITPSV